VKYDCCDNLILIHKLKILIISFPIQLQTFYGSMQKQTCFKKIHLNEDISPKNYIGCLIHYFMLSFIFVSIDSLQPMLLQQKFNINKSDQIENFKNSIVIGFDIAVKILCAPVFGYMADRYGRKKINLYGILCIGIIMMIMPYAAEFYQYIILRCIYAQGKSKNI
jgi:nitrate/nitrite transporter NarK